MVRFCLYLWATLVCGCAAEGFLRATSKAQAPMVNWDLQTLLMPRWLTEGKDASGMQGFLARVPLEQPLHDSLDVLGEYKVPVLSNETDIAAEVDTTTPPTDMVSAIPERIEAVEEAALTTTPLPEDRAVVSRSAPTQHTNFAEGMLSVGQHPRLTQVRRTGATPQPKAETSRTEKRAPRLSWQSSTAPASSIKRYSASQGRVVDKGHGGRAVAQNTPRREARANMGAGFSVGSRRVRDPAEI